MGGETYQPQLPYEEVYEARLEALHDYEIILDDAMETGTISGDEHDEALSAFQHWVEVGTLEVVREQSEAFDDTV